MSFSQWKWIEEPDRSEDPIRIYSVPDVGNFRLVAKCQRREDAELIVSLYEAHRKERV